MLTRISAYFDRIFTRNQIFKMALFACVFFIYFFPGRYLLYQTIAPPGWHIAIPLGSDNYAYKFAISPDVPGLVLSCGFAACFRSRNAGQDWQKIAVPAIGDLIAPSGGNGTFFLQAFDFGSYPSSPRIWVSHDSGTRWKRLYVIGGVHTIVQGIYRTGVLYDIGGPAINEDTKLRSAFALSRDDGQTWSYPEKSPSIAKQSGWIAGGGSLHDIAPDYSSSHAWFRAVYKKAQVSLLEHSNDDGQSWSTIGPIASSSYSEWLLSIATTPYQPNRLCASLVRFSLETTEVPLVILASKDGGKSWRTAPTPPDPQRTSGASEQNVQIGQSGNCYASTSYTTLNPGDSDNHRTFTGKEITTMTIWEMPVASLRLVPLFQSTNLSIDVDFMQNVVFAPKGNNLPAHLMIKFSNYRSLSPTVFYNDSSYLLLWRAVD